MKNCQVDKVEETALCIFQLWYPVIVIESQKRQLLTGHHEKEGS